MIFYQIKYKFTIPCSFSFFFNLNFSLPKNAKISNTTDTIINKMETDTTVAKDEGSKRKNDNTLIDANYHDRTYYNLSIALSQWSIYPLLPAISHMSPLYPVEEQLQMYPPSPSLSQVPSFKQEWLWQGSIDYLIIK